MVLIWAIHNSQYYETQRSLLLPFRSTLPLWPPWGRVLTAARCAHLPAQNRSKACWNLNQKASRKYIFSHIACFHVAHWTNCHDKQIIILWNILRQAFEGQWALACHKTSVIAFQVVHQASWPTMENNLGLLSAADDKPFPENNIKGEPCMQATSFWRRKSKGVVTDKMEETFLSQARRVGQETGRQLEKLEN